MHARIAAGVFLMASSLPAQLALEAASPPLAARRPRDVTVHGDTRSDDYFWLREKTSPAVLEHLRAENAYAEAVVEGVCLLHVT